MHRRQSRPRLLPDIHPVVYGTQERLDEHEDHDDCSEDGVGVVV
jgi:hypothetical protein